MEIIALIALVGSLLILLAKMYNLLSLGKFYDKKLIFVTLAVMLIFWILFFSNFMFQASAVETIVQGTDTWTIQNNDYLELSFYFNVINFAVLVGFFLTLAEMLILFQDAVIKPRNRLDPARR